MDSGVAGLQSVACGLERLQAHIIRSATPTYFITVTALADVGKIAESPADAAHAPKRQYTRPEQTRPTRWACATERDKI